LTNTDDVAAIANLIDSFVAGWNAGDGEACGRPFADDAVFTAITGLRAQGRDLIARGHTEILSTIYRGTQISATVNSINFLRPDVAAADVTLQFEGKQPFGLAQTSLGLVATKEGDTWSIAVFRNMVPFGRQAAGPVEQEQMRGVAARPRV
jgi:uncharacterized protein (TIGR02246 family)